MTNTSDRSLVEIYSGLIKPEKPLVVPLYRNDGTLLFQKGKVLSMEQIVSTLRHGDIYTLQADLFELLDLLKDDDTNAWQRASCRERTSNLIESLIALIHKNDTNLAISLLFPVNQIKVICDTDPNQAIICCLTNFEKHIKSSKTILTAIFILLLTRHLEWKENEITKLMLAGILFSILSDEFYELNEKKANAKSQSPHKEVHTYLSALNFNDVISLKYIQEYENHVIRNDEFNATGDLSWGCTLLALVNTFLNNLVNTSEDSNLCPTRALITTLKQYRSHYRAINKEAFLNVVGYYPSGSIIRFTTDEVGIVINQSTNPKMPYAKIFTDIKKRNKQSYSIHRVGVNPHNIKEIICDDEYFSLVDYNLLWK